MRRLDNDREAGSVSVFVIGLVVALMILAGLVVDGGRAINARAAATDDAEQAARAGANQIDEGELRGDGRIVLDKPAARQAAADFLAARGYGRGDVEVAVDGVTVSVGVGDDIKTSLLSLIMINSFHVTGSASARAAVGIVDEIGGAP
ncbi:Tad domain-containing protein [Cellulomonas rhizosphaerae]|uniref:Pilus assembly protein n=1 Tax=Cellulomonas rhizosphaerae TaxID=2293719 RepID=A0A413RP78_9CELL|nr:Tad domain-containing protein [Cellulomonas rhizosphaerae]RHA43826.1 pilus assembly protein [Cellulomonas rhizosphaerae]